MPGLVTWGWEERRNFSQLPQTTALSLRQGSSSIHGKTISSVAEIILLHHQKSQFWATFASEDTAIFCDHFAGLLSGICCSSAAVFVDLSPALSLSECSVRGCHFICRRSTTYERRFSTQTSTVAVNHTFFGCLHKFAIMEEMEDYLQEGFDPRTVTIPRLRSILVTHNVEYPATAKKGQLVDLVNDHVMPQAPKLRAQRARAKRSSMGIVNAGSAEDTGTWDDHDLLPPPPTSTRRSRSPRKASTRIKVEDDYLTTPAPRSPTKRSSRSASRQLSHTEERELEYEAPRSTRRSRRTVTPQIKPEPEVEEEILPPAQEEESVFTYDNPFQSGSSPAPARTPSNRRRTTGNEVTKSAKSSTRRRTDGYTDESRLLDGETSRFRQRTPEDPFEPGEEFTPDAQLELEEAASRGETELVPRKSSSQVARRSSLSTPLFVLFMALIGAYATWYRQEKIAVGYCGVGGEAKSLLPPDIPVPDALVPFVEGQCEPCPAHAYCYGDYSVRCEQDFILRPHPLSLGGLVPLPPTCEPDGEKARRVQAVADKVVEELRERRAKFECGELVDEEGHKEDSPAIPEEELKETVSRKRSKRLNSKEFDELWEAAIGEVTARDEVEVIEKTK